MKKSIRIAVVSARVHVAKTADNIDKINSWAEAAANAGAAILCFPEMNMTGYSTRKMIVEAALSLRDEACRELARIAKNRQITILAGLAEKGADHHIFASHLVMTPEGLAGVYRKLHIAPPEQKYFRPGKRIPLFKSGGLTFGIQLCYDAHFPELSSRMAAAGADLIFFPHASPRGNPEEKFHSWMRHLPARAFDNAVFVVACNQSGENGIGLDFPGLSLALNPMGEVIDANKSGKEHMLTVELKADELAGIRNHRMRYFFPNRRSDIDRLPLPIHE
jgi:N-carbamoylputrescine amidase